MAAVIASLKRRGKGVGRSIAGQVKSRSRLTAWSILQSSILERSVFLAIRSVPWGDERRIVGSRTSGVKCGLERVGGTTTIGIWKQFAGGWEYGGDAGRSDTLGTCLERSSRSPGRYALDDQRGITAARQLEPEG